MTDPQLSGNNTGPYSCKNINKDIIKNSLYSDYLFHEFKYSDANVWSDVLSQYRHHNPVKKYKLQLSQKITIFIQFKCFHFNKHAFLYFFQNRQAL